ncbi:unnamed protein product [Adineta ricciae]|uniref:G-protein coupled receptors family 1 profile domain-containing protein n=1 Tax=Adineta ricciae TaxID=249248 RepID=A0A815AIP3_ADIRI|nr:unnamed protein product [Adineta ricciae]
MIALACIYSIPIILIRRFHTTNNVFTVNLCFAAIFCGLYWLLNLTLSLVNPNLYTNVTACRILGYFEMMCTLQVPLALIEVSRYRLCYIVYHTKPFFRRKQWIVTCVVSQWTFGILISLLRPISVGSLCRDPPWMGICLFTITVITPSLSCLVMNLIIFNHVRSSTSRIEPSIALAKSTLHQHITRRDLRLLQHMIVMFCVFLVGWAPTYLYSFFVTTNINRIMFKIFMLGAELSITLDIINLFSYNHELTQYLKTKFLRRY